MNEVEEEWKKMKERVKMILEMGSEKKQKEWEMNGGSLKRRRKGYEGS